MSRAVLSLWRLVLPYVLLGIVCVLPFFGVLPTVDSLAAFVGVCCWCGRHSRFLHLMMRVRRFETWRTPRVIFHYEPNCKERVSFSILREMGEEALDEQALLFGRPLRRRLVVYLFCSWQSVSKLTPRRAAGLAFPELNAIVIAADTPLAEVIPHEIAHLFAARLNSQPEPFLREGLAVWFEGTRGGVAVGDRARRLLRDRNLSLDAIRKPAVFFGKNQHAHYVLAGSFTGWLIRRYGWARFKQYYRKSRGKRFKTFFRKFFGVSFEEAEEAWRRSMGIVPAVARL